MALVFLNDLNQILHNGKWEGLLSRIFPSNILIFINIVLIATLLLLSGFYLCKILCETRHKVPAILLYIMFGVLLTELDFCVLCAIFVQKNIKKGLVMPFVEFNNEFDTKISINTDYIIAIGEKWANRSYITTTASTILLNEDYQKVVNTIKHVTQQNKTL